MAWVSPHRSWRINSIQYPVLAWVGLLVVLILTNASLTNIDSLANLTLVGGELRIHSNPSLINVDGLANLDSVGHRIDIQSNTSLTNLNGLANLAYANEFFYLQHNCALTNINGLASLISVGGNLEIEDNDALTNLDGLTSLTSVGGALTITANAITNVDSLANLNSVGNIIIDGNNALTNLDGLVNLNSINNTRVTDNDTLTDCCGLLTAIMNTPFNSITINDNAFGCDSLQAIYSNCGLMPNPATFEVNSCNPPPAEVSWAAVPGATEYQFDGRTAGGSGPTVFETTQNAMFQYNGFIPNGYQVEFRIRAKFSNGSWTTWTAWTPYTISCP